MLLYVEAVVVVVCCCDVAPLGEATLAASYFLYPRPQSSPTWIARYKKRPEVVYHEMYTQSVYICYEMEERAHSCLSKWTRLLRNIL